LNIIKINLFGKLRKKKKMNTLDELSNIHQTDKGTNYSGPSKHGYTIIYDELLTPLRDLPIRMLEVGICMEGTHGGHSVRMWRDYFKNAKIYTFDIVDMSWIETHLEFEGRVHFYQGDQSDRSSMVDMYNTFGKKPFDFIIEDGSHIHQHQMISLAQLFPYVKSNGYYFLEDISIPNHPVCCIRNDETYQTLENFINTGQFQNKYLSDIECNYLQNNIKNIQLSPDIQDAYCVAIITKK